MTAVLQLTPLEVPPPSLLSPPSAVQKESNKVGSIIITNPDSILMPRQRD